MPCNDLGIHITTKTHTVQTLFSGSMNDGNETNNAFFFLVSLVRSNLLFFSFFNKQVVVASLPHTVLVKQR